MQVMQPAALLSIWRACCNCTQGPPSHGGPRTCRMKPICALSSALPPLPEVMPSSTALSMRSLRWLRL